MTERDEYVVLKDFMAMLNRYKAFTEANGREPAWIQTPRRTRVPLHQFKDMKKRYEEFLAREGRKPKVIYMTPQEKRSDGWVTTGYFAQDYQDTDHTCGPSSLQMALSALDCKVGEAELARAAGTLDSGTPHEGMLKAVQAAAKKCEVKLTAEFRSFQSMGWDKVAEHIRAGGEVIIHLITRPGLDTDVEGRVVWRKAFGHYVYLVGVNRAKGLVRIADPTKGVVTFPIRGVEQAMRNLSQDSLLLIRKKL